MSFDALLQFPGVNIDWLRINAISALLLPPLIFVLPALFGLLVRRWWPRFGNLLCVSSLLLIVVFSTAAGSRLLVAPLEARIEALSPAATKQAQAIVVLGGGRHKAAVEYAYLDSPSLMTLGRLRYAAHLHRQTGLPLLVTGGLPDGGEESEAQIMARVLQREFHVPVRWVEEGSINTAQNAALSVNLLREADMERILLVTDALHMPRARRAFQGQGLQVFAAPTYYQSHGELAPQDFIPGANGFRMTYYALHEWIGLLWYRYRYGF